MNRLEFNIVMETVGIDNPLSTTEGRYGTREDVHYWNNLAIWFGGSYYTIVHGKIPLEVANIIYEKYPENPYDIRVAGGCVDWNPIDWSEGGYLKAYHIDSKEGLLIFLTEMKDYFLRKNNLPETEVKRYDELIAKVSSEILKKANPSISAYDWMQGDEENKDNYNASIERDKRTEIGRLFRKAIFDFDKAVNPFLDESIELDDIHNYIGKVNISGNTFYSRNKKFRKGCSLKFSNPEASGYTIYIREDVGFSFELSYKLGDEQYLEVFHEFTTTGNYESDKGEVILISYYGDNIKNETNIMFNITNGKVGEIYKDKVPANMEQISFVYDELLKATKLASEITTEKMMKNHDVKQIKINN